MSASENKSAMSTTVMDDESNGGKECVSRWNINVQTTPKTMRNISSSYSSSTKCFYRNDVNATLFGIYGWNVRCWLLQSGLNVMYKKSYFGVKTQILM